MTSRVTQSILWQNFHIPRSRLLSRFIFFFSSSFFFFLLLSSFFFFFLLSSFNFKLLKLGLLSRFIFATIFVVAIAAFVGYFIYFSILQYILTCKASEGEREGEGKGK